jgi:hypothetical protein
LKPSVSGNVSRLKPSVSGNEQQNFHRKQIHSLPLTDGFNLETLPLAKGFTQETLPLSKGHNLESLPLSQHHIVRGFQSILILKQKLDKKRIFTYITVLRRVKTLIYEKNSDHGWVPLRPHLY